MKKIQINFLPYNINRFKYSVWCLNELTKIKDSNKEKILLKIYTSYSHEDYNYVVDFLLKNNINCELINMHGYMPKIYNAINTNEFYSCKWDEDIFLNYESWNYILENLDYLDENEDILFFSPILTNGIPSVDLFVHEAFNSDYKNKYINLIKNTNMAGNELANSWGVNYSNLNSETINAEKFNSEKYYKQVSKINHYYKGIHPVRISIDLHNLIFDFIQNNKALILESNDYIFFKINRPYFCNSFFFIKSNNWKDSLSKAELFKDEFDEVPLNLFREQKNIPNMAFISKSYAMHMAYNTIHWKNQEVIEQKYFEAFRENIEETIEKIKK